VIYYKKPKPKDFLWQFIPKKYIYLSKTKKVPYNGIELKTEYLIDIIHEFILKYYFKRDEQFEPELKFNIMSILLKKKYGEHYNYYINYLIEHEFLIMTSNYCKSKKARTYKLNLINLNDVTKHKNHDKVLLKKNTQEYLRKTFLNTNNSPIPLEIREKLVDDLYKVKIDTVKALDYLNDLKDKNIICHNKYQKNMISIENIGIENIFFKFDDYGRMHTNFTVLKKEIRNKFITIDGSPIFEVDIANSQPFFLALLMLKNKPISEMIKPDVSRYIDLVKNGIVYEEIMEKCNIKDRKEAKLMMYKVIFGNNCIIKFKKENMQFQKAFPSVHQFILDYKDKAKNYKVLAHDLQLMESDFIFNKIISHLISSYPDMPIFTVHDSINVPIKYKDDVERIFDYYKRNLLTL
jgi:hypothetical protein